MEELDMDPLLDSWCERFLGAATTSYALHTMIQLPKQRHSESYFSL